MRKGWARGKLIILVIYLFLEFEQLKKEKKKKLLKIQVGHVLFVDLLVS